MTEISAGPSSPISTVAADDERSSSLIFATANTNVGSEVVWRRPNMRGSKCPINGYIRLKIIKTIVAELQTVGDESITKFRSSCLGHLIRQEWGGFVSNAALHALFCSEIVREDAQSDEFWFRVSQRSIRFSRHEYAIVTGLRFGDSDFDVHKDDAPPVGSVYDRYPFFRQGGQTLDRIRDRFAQGYFRAQSGDALKVSKVLCICYLVFGMDGGKHIVDRWLWTLVEDTPRWENFPWGLYSYQILCTYLREVPTEVPITDRGYHFYGNIYSIMIWACEAIPSLGAICGTMLTAHDIQRPRLTRWKLKKLGPFDFSTFFDHEIDCYEVLTSTPEEDQELYMQTIDQPVSERVKYVHNVAIRKKGKKKGKEKRKEKEKGKEKGNENEKGRPRYDDDEDGGRARERAVRQRTSTSHPTDLTDTRGCGLGPEPIQGDLHCRDSDAANGAAYTDTSRPSPIHTHEIESITDLDTLYTNLCTYIDRAIGRETERLYGRLTKYINDKLR